MSGPYGVFTSSGPDVLKRRKGGGRLMLLGLPFFLAGLFVVQIPFGIIPVELDGGPLVLAIIVPLGPLFAGVGFILMASRSELSIDRKTRVVKEWWGLLIPLRKREHGFDRFTKIRMEFQEGGRSSPDTFSIKLIGAVPHDTIPIVDVADYEIALKSADDLSRFMDKPFENLTQDSHGNEPPQ